MVKPPFLVARSVSVKFDYFFCHFPSRASHRDLDTSSPSERNNYGRYDAGGNKYGRPPLNNSNTAAVDRPPAYPGTNNSGATYQPRQQQQQPAGNAFRSTVLAAMQQQQPPRPNLPPLPTDSTTLI